MFERLPMYQNIGKKAFKKDLANIESLCTYLNDPQCKYPAIHIAGTNGKGTVSHMLASVLQHSGLKVGLYTSPHYKDFRERIKINGRLIDEDEVIQFIEKHHKLLERISPSFFEISVAMAFDFFANQQVDIAIVETGLGGRLDSTNIINPQLSVITNISLDHMDMLGDSIYQISKEKAGIIKQNRPVVIGRYQTECDAVFFDKASAMKAEISFASLRWKALEESADRLRVGNELVDYGVQKLSDSPFFVENVMTSLEALHVFHRLQGEVLEQTHFEEGINQFESTTNYIGRWVTLSHSPLTIADSAHNFHALSKVVQHLLAMQGQDLHIVLGFVKDKNVDKLLNIFPIHAQYYFVKARVARGMDARDLEKKARLAGLVGDAYDSVTSGLSAAQSNASEQDIVFVGGSTFVVAEALN